MNDLNILSLVGVAGVVCVVIASALWYRIGKRKGEEVGFDEGHDAGVAEGWNERHFEQIARERKRRDRHGRFKSRPRENVETR